MNTSQIDADLSLRFSIFAGDSRFDWEPHLHYARVQTLYPPDLTARYLRALTQFREMLGDPFLRQVRYSHPLANMILEPGPWQVHVLCEHADLLQHLTVNDPDYPHLLQKLLSPVEAKRQAMYFLHIGKLLRSAGLGVRFPAEITGQKNPDIKITDPVTELVINGEVSRLNQSKDRLNAEHNYNQLHWVLRRHLTNPLYSAVQLRWMPEEYLACLGSQLAALQQQVAETSIPAAYTDDYFTITLFPLSQQEELYAWTATANRRKGLNGLPQDFDETRRIANNKIARKSKQLLADYPGVLFLPVPSLHFWSQRVTRTTAILQHRMKQRPQVLGAYLFAESLHVDAEQFRFNADDGFDRTTIAGALARYSLFIPNPAFDHPLPDETRIKLLSALSPKRGGEKS